MEEKNIKAKIVCKPAIPAKGIFSVWYVIAIILFIIGCPIESLKHKSSFYMWWLMIYGRHGHMDITYRWEFDIVLFLISILITLGVFIVPAIILSFYKSLNLCKAELTEKHITGIIKMPTKSKSINIPLDCISQVQVANGFFDKLRSGKTVKIYCHSKATKIHCVQNAEEFTKAIMEKVEFLNGN